MNALATGSREAFALCIHEAAHAVAFLAYGHPITGAEIVRVSDAFTKGAVTLPAPNKTLEDIQLIATQVNRKYESPDLKELRAMSTNWYAVTEAICSAGNVNKKEFERVCFGVAVCAAAGTIAEAKHECMPFDIGTEISVAGEYSDYDYVQDLAACFRKTDVGISRWVSKVYEETLKFVDTSTYWAAIYQIGIELKDASRLSSDRMRSIFDEMGCPLV